MRKSTILKLTLLIQLVVTFPYRNDKDNIISMKFNVDKFALEVKKLENKINIYLNILENGLEVPCKELWSLDPPVVS